jgi:FAD:protein FMN transferase
MNSPELDPRPAARRRGQARLRAVTAAVGAAGLAGAGVVAFALPGPAWLAGLGLAARLVAESGAVLTLGGWPPEPW